jgi:hypothetical protein
MRSIGVSARTQLDNERDHERQQDGCSLEKSELRGPCGVAARTDESPQVAAKGEGDDRGATSDDTGIQYSSLRSGRWIRTPY